MCRAEAVCLFANVLNPAAPRVISQVLNEFWFEWILVYVAKEGDEVAHVIARM